MAYTVAYCDEFMDELLDKMGSDYFPLPIKLRRFESIALQFIRESTNFLEITQEVSDDIVAWVKTERRSLSGGKNYNYLGKKFYRIVYPEDYLRFLAVTPVLKKSNNLIHPAMEVKVYRIGHFAINERNPFRRATDERVNVYRMDNSVLIDTDYNSNPPITNFDLTYARVPVFGTKPSDMIIDTSNKIVVDKLMHKTCVSLRATTSDSDTALLDDLVERQGQKIK